MYAWPPQLADLKHEMKISPTDTRDDYRLQSNLDAAIERVAELRAGDFDFSGLPELDEDEVAVGEVALTAPPHRICLWTLRLAWRWSTRTKSPDGTVDLGNDLGSARVAPVDPDIEAGLGVGRAREPMIG